MLTAGTRGAEPTGRKVWSQFQSVPKNVVTGAHAHRKTRFTESHRDQT